MTVVNNIDRTALLAQLRAMATHAGMPNTAETQAVDTENNVDFTRVLKDTVTEVNERQNQAAAMASSFELGQDGVELSQVMIEMQKARISFEALTQVRNKAVSAYQEIMNMAI